MSNQVRALLANMGVVLTPLAGFTPLAAYSLRLLNPTYTGPVVQVRRSSDSALNTFKASEIIDGTLISWVGAGNNGFVRTWYDQGSNLYHATQPNNAFQPQIVKNGSLTAQNTRPTILFDGADDVLGVRNLGTIVQPITFFAICSRSSFTNADVIFDLGDNSSGRHAFYNTGNTEAPNNTWTLNTISGTVLSLASPSDSSLTLLTALSSGANSAIYRNSTNSISGNAGTGALVNLNIGGIRDGIPVIPATYAFGGNISELLIYASNQAANRLAIEAEINSYYSIF